MPRARSEKSYRYVVHALSQRAADSHEDGYRYRDFEGDGFVSAAAATQAIADRRFAAIMRVQIFEMRERKVYDHLALQKR